MQCSNSPRGGPGSLATFPNTSEIGRVLGEVRAAFVKDLRIYLRYPSWIASEFITLPAWFVMFAIGVSSWVPKSQATAVFGSTTVFNFFYWGFIFLIVFSTSIWGIGQSIRTEQLQGTLEQLFLAPVNRVTIIIGRFARTILTDLAIIIYTVVLLGLLSHQTVVVQNPLALLLIFVFLEVAVLGFGFVFAALTFRLKSFPVRGYWALWRLLPTRHSPKSGPVRFPCHSVHVLRGPDPVRRCRIAIWRLDDPGPRPRVRACDLSRAGPVRCGVGNFLSDREEGSRSRSDRKPLAALLFQNVEMIENIADGSTGGVHQCRTHNQYEIIDRPVSNVSKPLLQRTPD